MKCGIYLGPFRRDHQVAVADAHEEALEERAEQVPADALWHGLVELTWLLEEIDVGERFLDAVLDPLRGLCQLLRDRPFPERHILEPLPELFDVQSSVGCEVDESLFLSFELAEFFAERFLFFLVRGLQRSQRTVDFVADRLKVIWIESFGSDDPGDCCFHVVQSDGSLGRGVHQEDCALVTRLQVVLLKPEAIERRVRRRDYKRLLRSFGRHLGAPIARISSDHARASITASTQAFERGRTEPSFRVDQSAPIRTREGLARLELKMASEGAESVAALLERTFCALDYHVASHKTFRLDPRDVDAIYPGVTQNVGDLLHRYLDGQQVRVLVLNPGPPEWVLHHWKTFLRHHLLDRTDPVTKLQNLLHVGEVDRGYLATLVKRDKIK